MQEKWKTFLLNLAKSVKNWLIVILLIIVVILLLTRSCSRKPCNDTIKIKSDTVKVPFAVKHDSIIKVGYPIYTDTGSTKWKPIIDSMGIAELRAKVKLFYATNYYSTILHNDSNYFAKVNYSVSQNVVSFMNFIDSLKFTQTTINNNVKIVSPDRFKLFIGISGILSPFSPVISADLAPSVIMTYRNWGVVANYGLFNKTVNLGLHYKLSLKRK